MRAWAALVGLSLLACAHGRLLLQEQPQQQCPAIPSWDYSTCYAASEAGWAWHWTATVKP